MFKHDLVKPMLPSFLSNIGESKHTHLIVESIKIGVSMHLANGRTTKHTTTREIIGTLASTKHVSGKTIAKRRGFDRHCIYQNLQCCGLIDNDAMDF
jgi:hypothetical protein